MAKIDFEKIESNRYWYHKTQQKWAYPDRIVKRGISQAAWRSKPLAAALALCKAEGSSVVGIDPDGPARILGIDRCPQPCVTTCNHRLVFKAVGSYGTTHICPHSTIGQGILNLCCKEEDFPRDPNWLKDEGDDFDLD